MNMYPDQFFPTGMFVKLRQDSEFWARQGHIRGVAKIGVVVQSPDVFSDNGTYVLGENSREMLMVYWFGSEDDVYGDVFARGKEVIETGVTVHANSYYYYRNDLMHHIIGMVTKQNLLPDQDLQTVLNELRGEL